MGRALILSSLALLLALPGRAAATEPRPQPQPATAAQPDDALHEPRSEPEPAAAPAGDRTERPWLQRWTPERTMLELGVHAGLLIPSRRVELFEADFGLRDQGYRPFAPVAPDLGLRLGHYPLRWFGIESEGGIMPTHAEPRGRALLWTVRGSLVAQLGLSSVTPFVLVGGGLLGVSSEREVVGNDVDAALHVGTGVKVYVSRFTALRLDVRDVISARRGYKEGVSNNPEILLGMIVTLGRATP